VAFPTTFKSSQDLIIGTLRLTDNTTNRNRVKDRLNQHYADIVVETEALQGTGTIVFTPGESSYLIDATILRIKATVVKQASQSDYGPPLKFTSLADILEKRQSGATPGVNAGTATHYTLLGAGELEFWPTPQTADTAKYYYVKAPTPLSADADPYDARIFPEPYPKVVELAALYDEAFWNKDPDVLQIERDRDMWLGKFRRHLSRRVGGFPHQFRVAGVGAVPNWDNSRDTGW